MRVKTTTPDDKENDFVGNNAAFTCPYCSNVFIVSGLIHRGKRKCPNCEKSTGYVEGGASSGGKAYIES